MTALTLVMNELSDFNPEEFYNVRAYHCWNKGINNHNRHGTRMSSPTISESSGVSSMVSCSSLESNMATPTKSIAILSRMKAKRQLIPATKEELKMSAEPQKLEHAEESDRIMYRGRDILNLTSNLKPQTWQLNSPLHNFIKANAISKRASAFQLEDEKVDITFSVMRCTLCDFEEPLSVLESALHRQSTAFDIKTSGGRFTRRLTHGGDLANMNAEFNSFI